MGKYQRTKGHSFERQVAIALRDIYPNAKRHLEMQMQECAGFDLDNTGPFRFQCKAMKKYAPLSMIEEVKPSPGIIPGLITKGDNKRPIVAIYLDDFIKILKDIGEAFVGEEPK